MYIFIRRELFYMLRFFETYDEVRTSLSQILTAVAVPR